MPLKNKVSVTLAFSFRLPVIPVAILRLVNLKNTSNSTDYTWDLVLAIVLAQVEMHFCLISSTIPCLRPFLKALDTGYLATQAAQVDRSIIDPGTESSYALKSKGSTNDPGSTRDSHRTSYRNSYQTKTTVGTYVPVSSLHSADTHDVPPSSPSSPFPPLSPPLPVARKWKSPEEFPVLDPYSSPAITNIHHPRQWRTGPSETVMKAKRSSNPKLTSVPQEEDIMLSSQSVDKWIIHKTVGYAVTRSVTTGSQPD
jgi:hypothetical protein